MANSENLLRLMYASASLADDGHPTGARPDSFLHALRYAFPGEVLGESLDDYLDAPDHGIHDRAWIETTGGPAQVLVDTTVAGDAINDPAITVTVDDETVFEDTMPGRYALVAYPDQPTAAASTEHREDEDEDEEGERCEMPDHDGDHDDVQLVITDSEQFYACKDCREGAQNIAVVPTPSERETT